MTSSSPSLPRYKKHSDIVSNGNDNASGTNAERPNNAQTATSSSQTNARHERIRRRHPSFSSRAAARTKPPSHERLVLVFMTASAFFGILSLSPFFFGNFPTDAGSIHGFHQHGDSEGNILVGLAGNKTLLTLHHWMGKLRQSGQSDGDSGSISLNFPKGAQSEGNLGNSGSSLARGVSGLPMSKTPALIGAQHGTIQCPSPDGSGVIHMDELAYWNDPQGELDRSFVSPFSVPLDTQQQQRKRKYVTFEPDRGGWNNIRMSMEIVLVFAAATRRTLVLPPDTPFYLLNKDADGKKGSEKHRHHGFADFLNFEHDELRKRVEIISMKEFLEMEGTVDGAAFGGEKLFTLPSGEEGKRISKASDKCYYMEKSERSCEFLYSFLQSVSFVPELQAGRDCLIFNEHVMKDSPITASDKEIFDALTKEEQRQIEQFCDRRNPIFFHDRLVSAPLIHFHAGEKHHRLLNHFYTFLNFMDPKIDHYYKRFVRDFMHYTNEIFCAAGTIIRMLEAEAGSAGYSALHVRRGDFQYKKVKITAEEWYENTKDLFKENDIIYVATDEKTRSFFEPLAKHYKLRFLNEFSEAAGLDQLDPNYAGMIDTIIASRAKVFVGTWFSTFTGYINRMRGYHGMSGTTSYYSTPDRKYNTHKFEIPTKVMTAREWPVCWVGIDGDEVVLEEQTLS